MILTLDKAHKIAGKFYDEGKNEISEKEYNRIKDHPWFKKLAKNYHLEIYEGEKAKPKKSKREKELDGADES